METERITNGDVCECDVQGMRLYQTLYIARGRGRRKVEMKRTDADDDCVCVESGESNPKVKLIHGFLVSGKLG